MLVAPSGAGKTPASKVFLDPVLEMEKEEKRSYDSDYISNRKKKKRRVNNSAAEATNLCASELEDEIESCHPERNLFHKKTRIIEQATPEALILNLYYGSPSLLIKADEFAVSLFILHIAMFIRAMLYAECLIGFQANYTTDNLKAFITYFQVDIVF